MAPLKRVLCAWCISHLFPGRYDCVVSMRPFQSLFVFHLFSHFTVGPAFREMVFQGTWFRREP
jgi:hypothetical protein